MTFPTILFAALIAVLYGALYHFARGGSGWRMLLYLGLSVLGFMAGQLLGTWRGWFFLMVGPINLGMGTLGSAAFLGLGDWLNRKEPGRKSSV
ncbi:MAG: hypothetical protein HZB19_14260 [Chloroflexi bacterium]|nr:hypothetical protein [Chloroflexota bacterium]